MTSKKTISARDAERNIGDELLQAIRDVKSGKYGAKYSVEANDIVTTRLKTGLSQAQFAGALRISSRTLQQWEQGRFVRFYGLTQWLGWIWPYLLGVFVTLLLLRRKPQTRETE